MGDPIDVCKICLRSDVKLKEINKILMDYHYVMTDFALCHIDSRLCLNCEHLLIKSYNFNQKCVRAAKILQQWHRNVVFGKTNRNPLEVLCSLVPQSSLKVCPQESIDIYTQYNESNTDSIQENNKSMGALHTQAHQLPFEDYHQENIGIYTYDEPESDIRKDKVSGTNTDGDIKKESIEVHLPTTFEEQQQNLVTVKMEEITFQEVLMPNNDMSTGKVDMELVNEDEGHSDGIDDASLSSDDENLAVKKLRRGQEINARSKKCINVLKKKKQDVFNDTDDNQNVDDVLKSEKYILAKLKNINQDLNTIYNNWEKTSLNDLPAVTVAKDDNTTRRSVARRKLIEKEDLKGLKMKNKGVIAKLATLSADLDSVRDNCGKLINYKEGLMNPIERLRAELTSKFASCGELKTEDGYVINKETIMACFDRVSECLMRRLWRFVHGKPGFEARAINTLKHIQNKYQNEYQYETVFTIEYLNTKEKVEEEFEKRRTYECYLNAKYKCETCYLGFKYEAQMENHKHSHEESAGEFPCPTCGVRHKSKRSLDTHSKSHEAVYKCKLCPLVTYYRYSMMNHYNQHKGKEYKCELCDTTFRSKSAYKTHCGLRHSAGDKICTVCGRSLASERALTWHMARHTRDSAVVGSPVPCAPCNLSFATQQAYLRHARTAHNSAPYTKQKGKEDAPKKKPVHTCRVCNAVGNSIGWLTLHFRLEHPTVDMALTYADKQLHLCEICGKGYANVYNLRDHLAIHAGVRAHACSSCGARFHRAVSLAQHRLTHLPPRRACHACGKRFHSQSNLNNHMRGHSGDRRYKCSLCGKGFLHRNALNEHVRGVHYKMRRVRKRTDALDTQKLTHQATQ